MDKRFDNDLLFITTLGSCLIVFDLTSSSFYITVDSFIFSWIPIYVDLEILEFSWTFEFVVLQKSAFKSIKSSHKYS